MLSRITLMTMLMLPVACADDPPPQREWTPADHVHPKAADPSRVPAPSGAEDKVSPAEAEARAARALFNLRCATCHGRDGRGGGPAKPPGAQMPDLADAAWQASRSDAQINELVTQGRGLMPAFGKEISADGITVLVRYMRALAGASAGPAAGPSDAGSAQPSTARGAPPAAAPALAEPTSQPGSPADKPAPSE